MNPLPLTIHAARGFLARGIGLMGRRHLPAQVALWLPRCRSVHTCFMRMRIDIVGLDADQRITALLAEVPPWRFPRLPRSTRSVLELAAGQAAARGWAVGDAIDVDKATNAPLGK